MEDFHHTAIARKATAVTLYFTTLRGLVSKLAGQLTWVHFTCTFIKTCSHGTIMFDDKWIMLIDKYKDVQKSRRCGDQKLM
jgi:hypothetical protein